MDEKGEAGSKLTTNKLTASFDTRTINYVRETTGLCINSEQLIIIRMAKRCYKDSYSQELAILIKLALI